MYVNGVNVEVQLLLPDSQCKCNSSDQIHLSQQRTTTIISGCSFPASHLHHLLTFWCNDSTICGKLANWNSTKKMSCEERCCHSSWLVPPMSTSKCSSVSERSMAYTTRSTSCSSNTGQRCLCCQGRGGALKDTENSGQGREEVKQRKGRKDVPERQKGDGNMWRQMEGEGRRNKERQTEGGRECQEGYHQHTSHTKFNVNRCVSHVRIRFIKPLPISCMQGCSSLLPVSWVNLHLTHSLFTFISRCSGMYQWCYYGGAGAELMSLHCCSNLPAKTFWVDLH